MRLTNTMWELVRLRRDEVRNAAGSNDFEAFADLGSTANRRLMLILYGAMSAFAGFIGTIALFPYADRLGMRLDLTAIIGVMFVGLGVVMFLLPASTPMPVLDAALVTSVVTLAFATSQGTGRLGGYTSILFVWPATGAVILRSTRAAAMHLAAISAASALTFALDDSFADPFFWWAILSLMLVYLWVSLGWVVRRARALAVSEHRARTAAESASVALAAVNREQSDSLRIMSRRFQAPLDVVVRSGTRLARGGLNSMNDRQARFVNDIVEASRHLRSLVEDMVDETAIESADEQLVVAPVHPRRVVASAVRLVRDQANREGVELRVVHEGAGQARIDERRIRQALVNLLSNAVRFTPSGGVVTVKTFRDESGTRFSVQDTGIGIDPAFHETVFEAYRQPSGNDAAGTGLGLAVARRFVELHGGHFWLESEVGIGSRFHFLVPDQQPEPSAVPAGSIGPDVHGPAAARIELFTARDLIVRFCVSFGGFVFLGTAFGSVILDEPAATVTLFRRLTVATIVIAAASAIALAVMSARKLLVYAMVVVLISAGLTAYTAYEAAELAALAGLVWLAEAFVLRLIDMKLNARSLWWHAGFVAVVFAVILGQDTGNDAPAAQWIAVVGTLAAMSYIASWLVDRLERLGLAEHVAADAADCMSTELEGISANRTRFLATTSHELRTPLNAVIGFAELLDSELVGPLDETQRASTTAIVRSARELLTLVDGVLAHAKSEAQAAEDVGASASRRSSRL